MLIQSKEVTAVFKIIIKQAISSSEQGNTTEFNALREYLLALDENNNPSNKNTIRIR